MPNIILTLATCTEPTVLKAIAFLQIVLQIFCIVIPIILIVMLAIDIFKNVISQKEDEMKKNFKLAIKRIIYCIAIFLVPTIVSIFMRMVENSINGLNINYTGCFENAKKIEHYEKLAEIEETKKTNETQQKLEEQRAEIAERNAIKANAITKTNNSNGTSTNDSSSSEGTTVGQTYNLSDDQLIKISKLCYQEQGSVVGAAAEASLMANLFELQGSKFGTGADGLYNYVRTSGWFAHAAKFMDSSKKVDDNVVAAVKEVLILGKRTLPLYINEHDCFSDISSITNCNGSCSVSNRGSYIKDKTIINNSYGSVYTFYTFPTESSDPFGYTESAKKKYDELNTK